MSLPALTGSGVSIFVMPRSAEPTPTVVVAVAELFALEGSAVDDDAVAVFVMMVPDAVAGATRTTSVNAALPAAKLEFVHDTVPFAPTAGVVHVHPAGALSEANVVPAGSASVITAEAAVVGPAFVTVIA
jgi:hypothetical protein